MNVGRSPSRMYRDHIKTLERRHGWLTHRLANWQGGHKSHDKAERAALRLAIDILREHRDEAVALITTQMERATK